MTGTEIFQNFQVTIPEGKRYWEDDSTGLIVKRGQIVEVNQRQFRSSELRFGLIRSQVLIKSGQCQFAFKDHIVKITPGNNKNIVVDLEVQNETTEIKKVPIEKDNVLPKVKQVKEKISEV